MKQAKKKKKDFEQVSEHEENDPKTDHDQTTENQ